MLPPRLVKLRQDKMDEKEEDFYQALYTQSQAQFNTYLQASTRLNEPVSHSDTPVALSLGSGKLTICASRTRGCLALQSGTVLNNYAHIFDILIRYRVD
jgi:hypothetical protein